MKDINVVSITGRLTRDAELRFTSGGFGILKFSLASNYSKKDGDQWKDEANFFDCTILGKRGESLAQYLTKGTQVMVAGELRQERWEKDGQKQSKITIMVDGILLTGGKQQGQAVSSSHDSEEVPF